MSYYIGIDGGGTHSRLLAVSREKKAISEAIGGPTNLASYPEKVVKENIRRLVYDFLSDTGYKISQCLGICVGSAGIDRPEDALVMEKIIASLGFDCNIIAINDSEIVLETESRGRCGAVIVSGTGSIAFGKDRKGNKVKSGGWGHLIGDEGSGYWIAIKAIEHAVKHHDKRGEHTLLLTMILEAIGIEDPYEIIDFIYYRNQFNKGEIASLSKVVDRAAMLGDRVAIEIMNEAVEELYSLGKSILDTIDMDCNESIVVCSGGVLTRNDYIYSELASRIKESYNGLEVIRLTKEPVWGAIEIVSR